MALAQRRKIAAVLVAVLARLDRQPGVRRTHTAPRGTDPGSEGPAT
jgi:hypothetical protein